MIDNETTPQKRQNDTEIINNYRSLFGSQGRSTSLPFANIPIFVYFLILMIY